MKVSERQLEDELIDKLADLKYVFRDDIYDRATLERNFREKFQALNRVKLEGGEFQRLLEEIVTPTEQERYSRRVSMKEIAENDYNLNISRYVSTAEAEKEIDLAKTHAELVKIDSEIRAATKRHNEFLKELGLALLPLQEESTRGRSGDEKGEAR